MRKIFSAITFIILSLSANGQQKSSTVNLLSAVNTVSKAEEFIKSNPKLEGKLFSLSSGVDTTEITLPLYEQKPGYTFRIGNYLYKIISIDSALSFRVSYIYIDGAKYSKREVDSIRNEIIAKYNAGSYFYDLASQYNMDGNVTGDLGWFTENMMVPEFEAAVKSHKKNEIFTVDTPSRNWYHVVLKTFDDTFLKKVTVLRTKSSN